MNQPGVARGLGLWSATALVISNTVAVGIFLTPAELIGALASPALTFGLWLGCGALILAGALSFGELASRYPQAGGLYVYLRGGGDDESPFSMAGSRC
jgi:basic amino acid/polyamine antiporter, APA family